MDSCDTPDCNETLQELYTFLDGELTGEVQSAIHRHLELCSDCYGAFDFHAELKQVISAKCNNDEMPPSLLSRIERCFDTDFDGDGVIG